MFLKYIKVPVSEVLAMVPSRNRAYGQTIVCLMNFRYCDSVFHLGMDNGYWQTADNVTVVITP